MIDWILKMLNTELEIDRWIVVYNYRNTTL